MLAEQQLPELSSAHGFIDLHESEIRREDQEHDEARREQLQHGEAFGQCVTERTMV
jgi:hypothetical protein